MRSRIHQFAMRRRGTVAAALILVLALAGTAIAGTGRGADLELGVVNTINSYLTTLKGSFTGPMLQVTNTGTGRGIGITVAAGKAPIYVNSTAGKAVNLNADKLDGLTSAQLQRDATSRLSTDADVTTGAYATDVDWVSLPFTQPAGRTFVGYIGEAIATVPPTCTGGTVIVQVYLDGKPYGNGITFWTAPTANTEVAIGWSGIGGASADPARVFDVAHTLGLRVRDECGDGTNWTFTSAVFDVIIL